jgi:PHS family inorganic phosphate transporter-like MFS transporter
VAASGFLTGSYNLFATNVILPILGYIYWPNETSLSRESAINGATLGATALGELLFGFLADKFGRQKLYGVELIIVTVSTLGLAQSSYGVPKADGSGSSMSFLAWILMYRSIMGIGIGGEYPLSAIITSGKQCHSHRYTEILTHVEWASVRSRPRMLASVFAMQAFGQLAAYLVALVALIALDRQYHIKNDMDRSVVAPVADKLWRWVTGLGAIPAILSLAFRLTIPESGRWTLDVQGQANRALMETTAHFGPSSIFSLDDDLELREEPSVAAPELEQTGHQFSRSDLHQYFITDGNWRYLAGTSLCWFILDYVYYALQINNPRFLARIWASHVPSHPLAALPSWLSDQDGWDSITQTPTITLYDALMSNLHRALISVSIGAVLGSLLLILLIPYFSRRRFLIVSLVVLAALTAAMGISLVYTFQTSNFGVTVAFFVLCQLCFNLGPNSLTFIVSFRPAAYCFNFPHPSDAP